MAEINNDKSIKIREPRFIACTVFEDTITWCGEGNTPAHALADFLGNGEFEDYCFCKDIPENTFVEVKVFSTMHIDDPDANPDDFEEHYEWICNDEISSQKILYLPEPTLK